MTNSIYDQHDKHFTRVSAYVIMNGADRVATVAFKFPADGAGRLYVYVHWVGTEMVRGSATGYGYDKRSAAVYDAGKRLAPLDKLEHVEESLRYAYFVAACSHDDGHDWSRHIEDAGFKIWQAV